jgi:hypothetical protein
MLFLCMIQLYFLSILCNGAAGYLLFSGSEGEAEKPQLPINTPTFCLVLGIISAITGILKLLSPIPSSINAARGVLIFGDLIPAAAGIVAGIVLIFGLYRKESAGNSGELDRIGTNLLTFRRPLGLALLAAAFVHFIFGEIIFL